MRPLRYAINVTLDGCVHHEAVGPDEELHRWWGEQLAAADAMLLGRVTYQMMESAWRRSPDGTWPDWMADWMVPFASSIDAARKYVVSSTMDDVDWNAELLRGDLAEAVTRLKDQPGGAVHLGGVTLPLALADLGLVDEYVFVVHPVVAGRGPTLLDGLRRPLTLRLVDRQVFGSGAVAHRYVPGDEFRAGGPSTPA
ncbi:dihydrofolate reductase family protein [Aquipuribacter sp. SD81]|uniref:dihydrofolate reductase family protein n=1 Tax=Aquipuribacter sp. SD81 TaxID=3127703 RepID=UPI0030198B54